MAHGRAASAGEESQEAWRRKAITDWSNEEVRAFLQAVLPGHDRTELLQHWTGRVLASASKDDLRKQAKDDEVANIIWAELRHLEAFLRERDEINSRSFGPFTVFIRSPTDVALELEVQSVDTVAEVKVQLAKIEGTPPEMQRLMWNGVPMLDTRTLSSYNVGPQSVILLVPRLSGGALGTSTMRSPVVKPVVPNATPVPISGIPRPQVPVLCADMARPFPMSIEFTGIKEYQGFMQAVMRGGAKRTTSLQHQSGEPRFQDDSDALFLEVLPADSMRSPVQTRIQYDSEIEALRIDTLGDILMQRTRYRVLLHLQDERKRADLVTGSQS